MLREAAKECLPETKQKHPGGVGSVAGGVGSVAAGIDNASGGVCHVAGSVDDVSGGVSDVVADWAGDLANDAVDLDVSTSNADWADGAVNIGASTSGVGVNQCMQCLEHSKGNKNLKRSVVRLKRRIQELRMKGKGEQVSSALDSYMHNRHNSLAL